MIRTIILGRTCTSLSNNREANEITLLLQVWSISLETISLYQFVNILSLLQYFLKTFRILLLDIFRIELRTALTQEEEFTVTPRIC